MPSQCLRQRICSPTTLTSDSPPTISTIRYARRSPRPDGGADLLLVADSRIWVWWDAKNDLPANEPYTVLHIRLDKNGNGEGKIAPASKVRRDAASGIAVADYESLPVLITRR